MSDEEIRIERAELFGPEVDKALARQRAGRERIVADPPPVSPIRRLLNNSLFYLPIAAVLATLATWLLLEPKIADMPSVGGEVLLINSDPFDAGPGITVLTIGSHEVYVVPDSVVFEALLDAVPATRTAIHTDGQRCSSTDTPNAVSSP